MCGVSIELSPLYMKYRPGFLSSVLVSVIAILSLLVPAPVHAGAGATVAPDAGTAGTSVPATREAR